MERKVGTVSRGIRGPIIRQGDDLREITVTSVLEAAESEGFSLRDRDVIAVTESIVARSQGNYASVNDIAADVKANARSRQPPPLRPARRLPHLRLPGRYPHRPRPVVSLPLPPGAQRD